MEAIKSKKYSHVLRFDRGDELISGLADYVRARKINFAQIEGIGAVTDVELGYYDLPNKTYHKKLFTETYELIGAFGNVSLRHNEPFVHIHMALSGEDFSMFGGHCFSATVAVVGEFFLRVQPVEVHRDDEESLGLHIWNLETCKIANETFY